VTVVHAGGRRYLGSNANGDRVILDGGEISLGMKPTEALLVALGGCTAVDVVEILTKRRTPPESYRIELEGDRAEEHPRRFTRIRVRHIVRGEGITRASLERAIELSHEKYCSVSATLNAEIEHQAVLEGAEEPAGSPSS
jgi:putative redox protein